MAADLTFVDDTELEMFKFQAGSIVRCHKSLNEDRIMAENAMIRSEGLARSLSWGRPLLRMSIAQLHALEKRFPVLKYGPQYQRTKKWKEIARDPEFRALWVRD